MDSDNRPNKKVLAIGGVILLLIGLGVALYIVQQRQTLESQASTNILNAFEIKDASGNVLNCTGGDGTNPPTCTTNSLDVSIKVKDLNALTAE